MSGYQGHYYRGKLVMSEADREWADRDEDAIADAQRARWLAKYGTPARVVSEFDPSACSETEKDWHPEAAL